MKGKNLVMIVVVVGLMGLSTSGQTIYSANSESFENNVKTQGFSNTTNIEIYSGLVYGLRSITGYQINKHFFIGIGIGINKQKPIAIWHDMLPFQDSSYYTLIDMPIYFDLRYEIRKHKHSFFAYIDIGDAILLSPKSYSESQSFNGYETNTDTYSSGLMYDFGVGYKLFLSPRTAIMICLEANYIGINHNVTLYEWNLNWQPYPNISNSGETIGSYPALGIGFCF